MPAKVEELIEKWKATREELIRLRTAFPDEPLLGRPLLPLRGVWPEGTVVPQFHREWDRWMDSVDEVIRESREFFNYYSDSARFFGLRFYVGYSHHKSEFRFNDCLRSMGEVLDLLGWHDKSLGERVDERMNALQHKQDALATAMGIASSTLGRIRTGKTEPSPAVRAALLKYLDGKMAGFGSNIEDATDAS
jgi:hypothetical protein